MSHTLRTFEIPAGHQDYPRGALVIWAGAHRTIVSPRTDGTYLLELEHLDDLAWHLMAFHEADTAEQAFALATQALAIVTPALA